MPAASADFDRRAERFAIGNRDDDAVGMRRHRRVDHLAHRRHIEDVGRFILDIGIEVSSPPRRDRS